MFESSYCSTWYRNVSPSSFPSRNGPNDCKDRRTITAGDASCTCCACGKILKGQPRHVDLMRKLIINQPGGQYLLDLRYFDFTSFKRMYSDEMLSLFGHPPRPPRTEILDFHKDLARSLQDVLEEILMDKLTYLHEVSGIENLCMAGGVALNCV